MSLFDQYNWQGERGFPYHWGYYWLGPVQIPPLPFSPIGLTDTVTGTVYYLELNSALTNIVLNPTAPTKKPLKVYLAGDGPYIQDIGAQLQVQNGKLVVVLTAGVFGGGPFAMSTSDNTHAAGFYPVTTDPNNLVIQLGFTVDLIKGGVFDPTP